MPKKGPFWELPANVRQCIENKKHLTWCDDDGYCNYCGYQESAEVEEEDDDAVIPDPSVFGDVPPPHGWFFSAG